MFGVAHHDTDIVTAALNPLYFGTEKSLSHLAAQILYIQTEQLRFGLYGQFDFVLAAFKRVLDVEYSRILRQPCLDQLRHLRQLFEILPRELNVYGITPPADLRAEAQLLRARYGAYHLPEFPEQIRRADAESSVFRGYQLHADLAQVGLSADAARAPAR